MTSSALGRTISSTDTNDDKMLVVTTHEVTQTYDARALQKPRFISIDIGEHDIYRFVRAVRELEAIDWADRHYHAEAKPIMLNRVPASITRYSDGAYVLMLPGVSVHYSRAQVLEAAAALEKEYQRRFRLQFTH